MVEPVTTFRGPTTAYYFGPFQLDPEVGLLFRGSQAISLTPKGFNVLLYLVERSGRLVTKDDLMKAVWPDTFVAEANLTQTIFVLRKALAEKGGDQRYIVTVPGRGYRFAAQVHRVLNNPNELIAPPIAFATETASAAPASVTGEVPITISSEPRRNLVYRYCAFLLTLALLLLAGAYRFWWRPQVPSSPALARKMLAVLPFENLTGDAGQDYLSDGFTEEMITQLGKLNPQSLGVIARTSIERYKHGQLSAQQVSHDLGVEYVLEGSVRRNGERVRITAQLIRVSDQTPLWAREYDRDMKDLLQLQAEIAQEIADEIQLSLGMGSGRSLAQTTRSPASYEAYDLYLKGRYFWEKRTPQGFRQAIALYQNALRRDPEYALAYAGLADAYAMVSGYGLEPAKVYMPRARAAALQALQIDGSLAEAHTSLAIIAENYDYDWQTAEKEFRRAIELNPNYATAHQWYAECLAFQGRFEEALAESERARQLDPLSLVTAADNGAILYYSRDYDRAIERFHGVLDMDPRITRAHLIIAAYAQKGQFKNALADIERWRRTSGDAPWIWAWEAYVYGCTGDHFKSKQALKKLEQLDRRWHLLPEQFLGVAYAGTVDRERWLDWLQGAYENHNNVLADLRVDPRYDQLRSEPRFHELLHRVGLDK